MNRRVLENFPVFLFEIQPWCTKIIVCLTTCTFLFFSVDEKFSEIVAFFIYFLPGHLSPSNFWINGNRKSLFITLYHLGKLLFKGNYRCEWILKDLNLQITINVFLSTLWKKIANELNNTVCQKYQGLDIAWKPLILNLLWVCKYSLKLERVRETWSRAACMDYCLFTHHCNCSVYHIQHTTITNFF